MTSAVSFQSLVLQVHCRVKSQPIRILRAFPARIKIPQEVMGHMLADLRIARTRYSVQDHQAPFQCSHLFDSAVQLDWTSTPAHPQPPQLQLYLLLAVQEKAQVSLKLDLAPQLRCSGSLIRKFAYKLHPPKRQAEAELLLPIPTPLGPQQKPRPYSGLNRFSISDFNEALMHSATPCSSRPSSQSSRRFRTVNDSRGWMSRHSIGEGDESASCTAWRQLLLSRTGPDHVPAVALKGGGTASTSTFDYEGPGKSSLEGSEAPDSRMPGRPEPRTPNTDSPVSEITTELGQRGPGRPVARYSTRTLASDLRRAHVQSI